MPRALRWHVLLALLIVTTASAPAPTPRTVILSTTTSTQDSGLLDELVPRFERETGYTVKTIAVGTGQALALAARGEADVTLAHAPALETRYIAEGKLLDRRLVMFNDFIIVGPPDDPAHVRSLRHAVDALRTIAAAAARFISRGDSSGTHVMEQRLWREAGITPRGPWYVEAGQGMGATLNLAEERRAYTLSDRATYLALRRRLTLVIVLEGDRPLLNVYSVMVTNPANGPRVNAVGGRAFADWILTPATQALIGRFGVDRYGRPLFTPIAGKRDEDL